MMTEQAVISLGNVRKSYKGGFDLGPINLEVEPTVLARARCLRS
jgi:hypothetical protein